MAKYTTQSGVWADESLVQQLRDLWDEGLSCSQIARRLGRDITRNSVIGKATRLGLPARGNGSMSRKSYTRAKPVIVKEPPAPVVEEEPVTLEDGSHVTILTITDRMCRWPIGDPVASNFHFCGRAPKAGAPYCEAHCRKAYQPVQTAISRKKGEQRQRNQQNRAAA